MYLSKNKLMKPAILLPGQKMILLFSERNVNPPTPPDLPNRILVFWSLSMLGGGGGECILSLNIDKL